MCNEGLSRRCGKGPNKTPEWQPVGEIGWLPRGIPNTFSGIPQDVLTASRPFFRQPLHTLYLARGGRMAPHALTAEGKLVNNVMSSFVSTSHIFPIAFASRHKTLTDYTGNL